MGHKYKPEMRKKHVAGLLMSLFFAVILMTQTAADAAAREPPVDPVRSTDTSTAVV